PKGEAPGEDAVLEALFTRTYGAGSWRTPPPPAAVSRPARPDADPVPAAAPGQEYLLVDGYNILFAWPDLKALAQADLGAARHALADILSNYQGFKGGTVILVYDAYKVPGAPGEVEKYQNIYLVYTKEAETADMFIEKATKQLARQRRVRVASSDGMEQTIILGHGALRVSAEMFRREVEDANAQITRIIEENRLRLR
ncbi:NYN domain-containing protein, partial [Gemmiger formicilis]|uniref:NYN domain-containing protein n=1 Tax=Gemmiger formicilis TaxID=745368 RepID=UPI00195C60B0